MQIAMIGLGRMGANMAERLMLGGHACFAYDLDPKNVASLVQKGAHGASSLKELAQKMSGPRVVWVMVPAGAATDQTIAGLRDVLSDGDIVIDGGNSFYQDDLKHHQQLLEKGIQFMDAGTSGGVWGKERGYCLMIGGSKEAFLHCEPIWKTLAPGLGTIERTQGRPPNLGTADQGYLHCGPVGAGHFVKMIHNGIEYGIMQAYAEGFDILQGAAKSHIPQDRRYQIDVSEVAEVWRRGSVIGSWLLDLTAIALSKDASLAGFSGKVADSGEGRWTVNAAVEEGVAAEVLSTALFKRFRSREDHSFAEKLLSAMRFEFGGHQEPK